MNKLPCEKCGVKNTDDMTPSLCLSIGTHESPRHRLCADCRRSVEERFHQLERQRIQKELAEIELFILGAKP